MPQQPIAVTAYQHRSPGFANNRIVNMRAEPAEGQARTDYAFLATEGLTTYVDTGQVSKENRGFARFQGKLYTVIGERLFSIDAAGNHTDESESYGFIAGSGPVSMVADNDELVIVTGTGTDNFKFTGSSLSSFTGPSGENYTDVAFLGGYGLYVVDNPVNAGRYRWPNLNQLTVFTPEDFLNAEAETDALVRILVVNGIAWMLGERSCEPHTLTGGTPAFGRVNQYAENIGLAAKGSAVTLGDTAFMLGSASYGGLGVYQLQGMRWVRISTNAIEHIIGEGTYSDALGFAYAREGHGEYVLTLPAANRTFVYDAATSAWHERQSGLSEFARWDVQHYAFWQGKHLVGHKGNGKVLELDQGVSTEDGNKVGRVLTVQIQSSGEFYNFMKQFSINLDTGTTAVGSDGEVDFWSIEDWWNFGNLWDGGESFTPDEPHIIMQMSDDDGRTWGREYWAGLGKAGDYTKRLQWNGLGRFRERLIRIKCTEAVTLAVAKAFAHGSVGRR